MNPEQPYSRRDDIIVISDEAHRTQGRRKIVEQKLAQMLVRNPQRMDYYKKYQKARAGYFPRLQWCNAYPPLPLAGESWSECTGISDIWYYTGLSTIPASGGRVISME